MVVCLYSMPKYPNIDATFVINLHLGTQTNVILKGSFMPVFTKI